MKFAFAIAIVSSMSAFSAVLAAPTADANTSPVELANALFKKKQCPSDVAGISRGSCNGTSCRWAGVNFKCKVGKCTGNGGGDGSCCFFKDSKAHCPNGGW